MFVRFLIFQFRASNKKESANLANMFSGRATSTRRVPAIYGHLSPNGAPHVGQAKDAAKRDGQHADGEGNRLRQAEEKGEFVLAPRYLSRLILYYAPEYGPFADWLRETLLEIIGKMADPEVVGFFLYLVEHLFIAATDSNNPHNGLNWNAIDWAGFDVEKVPVAVLRLLWDGAILWVNQRLVRKLPANFAPSTNSKFWGMFSLFVCDLLTPASICAIIRGEARRSATKMFPRIPIEAFGGQYPPAMYPKNYAANAPFTDMGAGKPQLHKPRVAPVKSRMDVLEGLTAQAPKSKCE
jgi:hypothetical protein